MSFVRLRSREFFGRTKMMGSWSLALDDEELRFPDLPDALFEFVQVGADTLDDETPKLFARLGVPRGAMPLDPGK